MDSQKSLTDILEAASQMFTVYGYEETSISEICKELKISKGRFYYYFNDKEDLFTACCAHAYQLINEIFSLFTFERNATLKKNLLNLFTCYQKVFSEHEFLLYIIYTIHSSQHISVKEKILEIIRHHQEEFTRVINEMLDCFSIKASASDISVGFHSAFMSAYETEGVFNCEDFCEPTGNEVYDCFNYYIDKILFGVLPRDKDTIDNPKAARDA